MTTKDKYGDHRCVRVYKKNQKDQILEMLVNKNKNKKEEGMEEGMNGKKAWYIKPLYTPHIYPDGFGPHIPPKITTTRKTGRPMRRKTANWS